MSESEAYHATMQLAEERPDLLPLLRIIMEMGAEGFNDALAELVERGLLRRDVVHDPPIP